VRENVPNIDKAVISVHCHNDLGNAAPNSVAAVVNGARQVEGCINGLGERAGNASLEEIIMTIETRKELIGVATNIDTTQIYKTSRMVSDITGFPVQPNKAIVGANAFRHASGIHQDGVIKERSTFEIMRPESVGWPSSSLVLGKLSGRAGLRARLEQLGYTLDAEHLDKAFEAFKELADRKREVTDADLEALMGQQSREGRHAYALSSLQIVCGSDGVQRRADVTLTATDAEDDRYDGVGEAGNGPVSVTVDAINNALRHATGREVGEQVKFVHYEVGAITESVYALANVAVRVTYQEREFTGRGASADVMEASGKAYLDACNKALFTG
jgi:2-isopropylmalate synthase